MEIASVPWHPANVLRIESGSASESHEVYCAPIIPMPGHRPEGDVAWRLHRRDGSPLDAYPPRPLLDTLEAASEHVTESARDEFPWESPAWRATPFLKAATQDLHRFVDGLEADAGDAGTATAEGADGDTDYVLMAARMAEAVGHGTFSDEDDPGFLKWLIENRDTRSSPVNNAVNLTSAYERYRIEAELDTDIGIEAATVRWFPMDVIKVDMSDAGNRHTLYCVPAQASVNDVTGEPDILWTLRREDGGQVPRDRFLPLADTVQAAQAKLTEMFMPAPAWDTPQWQQSPPLRQANGQLDMLFAVVSDLGDADRRDLSYIDWLTDTLPVIRAHSGNNAVDVGRIHNEYQELKQAVAERLM